jgi:phosphoribosylamine--glycine ligase
MLVMVYAGVGGGSSVVAAADLDKINVLVVGGGGREHSLCWRLRLSPTCGDLFCCPGNAGIVVEEGVQTVDVNEKDHAAVVAFCEKNAVGASSDPSATLPPERGEWLAIARANNSKNLRPPFRSVTPPCTAHQR